MTTLTIEIPEDLAHRLQPVQDQMIEILEFGLQAVTPLQQKPYLDMIDFLASGPEPDELATLQASQLCKNESPSCWTRTVLESLLHKRQPN